MKLGKNLKSLYKHIPHPIIIPIMYIIFQFGYFNGSDGFFTWDDQNIEEKTYEEKTKRSFDAIIAHNKINKQIITKTGKISSFQEIPIISEVQGELIGYKNSPIKKGRKFKKGEILFKVKNIEALLLLESKRSQFLNLTSSILSDISIDFPNEEDKWEKYVNSIEIDKILPEIPKLTSNKEQTFIESKSIISQHKLIKIDEERLKKYTFKAPFDGSITKTYSDIGAVITPGRSVVDIIKNEDLEIEIQVNTSELENIQIGDQIKLHYGTDTILAIIVRKGNIVNRNTENISVFAKLNEGHNLYGGMSLTVSIDTYAEHKSVSIPERAIFGNNEVYIVTDGKLRKKSISKLSSNYNRINITGVKDSTVIIIEPIIEAEIGMEVTADIK